MRRIGLICLAVVLALGSLGVAYAAWSDTVVIEQTVQTGTVRIGFSKAFIFIQQEKPIASGSATLTGEIIGSVNNGEPIYEGVEFVIDNAYPCITVYEFVDIASAGTIPVHILPFEFSMTRTSPEPEKELDVQVVGGTGKPGDEITVHFKDDQGRIVMILELTNAVGVQLHQGDKTVLQIHKKFQQPMEQNATYVMKIYVTGIQYNKDT